MTKWIVIVAGGLIMASCSPNGETAKSPENKGSAPIAKSVGEKTPPATQPEPKTNPATSTPVSETSISNSPEKTMIEHELLAYFQVSERKLYANCHSEKAAYDDYLEGKVIPKELVKKYRLYKFNMSPTVGLKFKKDDPMVVVKGGQAMTHNDMTILIYHVGICMEAKESQPNEGVDTRAYVLDANGEKMANYFIGGYVKQEDTPEANVCRKVTFKDKEMVLTLDEANSPGLPSHLKLLGEETRDLF